MAKERANKYDKKLSLNASFHDAVNTLMTKGAKNLKPNNVQIKINSDWPEIGTLIPNGKSVRILYLNCEIEYKINNATGNQISNSHSIWGNVELENSLFSSITPAMLYVRCLDKKECEISIEFF